MKTYMLNKIREMKLESFIKFIGPLNQKDLVNFYYSSDIIIFTHAGITLVEAGLSGKPIVAYDYEWHSEFLGYEERGYLAYFRDYKNLANKVNFVLDNYEIALKKAQLAREFALRYFNKEEIIKLEKNILQKYYNGDFN